MTNLSSLVGFGAGGGSGASELTPLVNTTAVSSVQQTVSTGRDYQYYYVIPGGSSHPKGHVGYGLSRHWYNTQQSQTGHYIQQLQVNPANGQLTLGSDQSVFLNSSGAALSTTYLTYNASTGAFFSGGHNAYPGYSSHVFGYSKGVVQSNGTLTNQSATYTNSDHGYNGMFPCDYCPSGHMISGGYNSSSRAGYRIHTSNSSSVSVGGFQQYSSYTSTTGGIQIYGQPDYSLTTSDVVGMIVMSGGSSGYGIMSLQHSGSTYYRDWTSINGSTSHSRKAFRYSDGSLIIYFSNPSHGIWRQVGVGTPTQISTYLPSTFYGSDYHYQHIGLGNNRWLSVPHVNSLDRQRAIVLWEFNSSYQFVELASFASPPAAGGQFAPLSHQQTWHPVWANTSASLPSYYLRFMWQNGIWSVNSFSPAVNLSSYF